MYDDTRIQKKWPMDGRRCGHWTTERLLEGGYFHHSQSAHSPLHFGTAFNSKEVYPGRELKAVYHGQADKRPDLFKSVRNAS